MWPRFDVTGTGSHMTGSEVTGTGSHMTGTGSDVTGTGSDGKGEGHVIWDGKLLTSGRKGVAGSD